MNLGAVFFGVSCMLLGFSFPSLCSPWVFSQPKCGVGTLELYLQPLGRLMCQEIGGELETMKCGFTLSKCIPESCSVSGNCTISHSGLSCLLAGWLLVACIQPIYRSHDYIPG